MPRSGKQPAALSPAPPPTFVGLRSHVLPPIPLAGEEASTVAVNSRGMTETSAECHPVSVRCEVIPSITKTADQTGAHLVELGHHRMPEVDGTPLAYLESVGFQTLCEAIVVSLQ
jgi:hypothetical protein